MTVLKSPDPARCGCDAASGGLPSVDDAARRIDAEVSALPGTEAVALPAARGRVLADAVRAGAPSPAFDNAAMDGYAVATAALRGEGPWSLRVSGVIAAGEAAAAAVTGDTAVRIFTGAAIPAGADAVVMQEDVRLSGGRVALSARPRPGANIRRKGEDMGAGDAVVAAGTRLGSRQIGAAAAAGLTELRVRRPVRVALLVTGAELRPGAESGIGDVNGPMLAAEIARPDAALVRVVHAGDDQAEIADAMETLAGEADLLVTTGGLSVGDADLVRPALRAAGGRLFLEGVAIKPGKPVAAGHVGNAVWLGLPGNPVAAFVTWTLFGRRILDRLAGASSPGPARRIVSVADGLPGAGARCEFRPARIVGMDRHGREVAAPADGAGPARLAPLGRADGLVLIASGADPVPPGGLAEYISLSDV